MATTTTSTTPMPMTPEALLKGDLVPYGEADSDKRGRIELCIAELEMDDANSIIFFGSKAQKQLTTISDHMLEGVRNKDTGPAGASLNSMVTILRGFDVDGLDPRLEPSWIQKIFGWGKPVAKFLQRYEEVRDQIDRIGDELEHHKTTLMTDIASLDRLYEANLEYFHTLADYIAAGEEMLKRADEDMIPALHKEAEASGDVLKAQELRDLRSARDDLERRVHDLRLTRQVAMQGLPSIRLVQENDKSLLTKINSTMATGPSGHHPSLESGVENAQERYRSYQRTPDLQCRKPKAGQCRDQERGGTRCVRHRGGQAGQRDAD